MNVLVDTSVWSLALRRRRPADGPHEHELRELLREGRVVMMGPIRQELLSGVQTAEQFKTLKLRLRAFDDLLLVPEDYEEAAACFNRCRASGVQGSSIDVLICAVSLRRRLAVLTTDSDFDHYAKVLPLKLHQLRAKPPSSGGRPKRGSVLK